MRIVENVKTVVVIPELKGIICNCCGECFGPNYTNTTQQFNLNFGYGSKYGNQKPWEFEMCEMCIIKLIKGFKHVPENFMSEKSIISACDTDSELHQRVFEEWQETGEWNWEDEDPYKEYYQEDENEEDRKHAHTNGLKLV